MAQIMRKAPGQKFQELWMLLQDAVVDGGCAGNHADAADRRCSPAQQTDNVARIIVRVPRRRCRIQPRPFSTSSAIPASLLPSVGSGKSWRPNFGGACLLPSSLEERHRSRRALANPTPVAMNDPGQNRQPPHADLSRTGSLRICIHCFLSSILRSVLPRPIPAS